MLQTQHSTDSPTDHTQSGAGSLVAPWYALRGRERIALAAMVQRYEGIRVLIIEGPPGVGKTSLGHAFAEAQGAKVIYYLCHHWTTEEDLFLGIDVGRVAAGISHPSEAYRPGVFMRAVLQSQEGPCVLILDEVDKAPERMEALLLEFLQTGRVYGLDGDVFEANPSNLFVFITTNGLRPLMDATLRRGFRLHMTYLPPKVETELLDHATGAHPTIIQMVVRMANRLRYDQETSVSLQEIQGLLADLPVASNIEDVRTLVRGWLCRTDDDWKFVQSAAFPQKLWGRLRAVRGR